MSNPFSDVEPLDTEPEEPQADNPFAQITQPQPVPNAPTDADLLSERTERKISEQSMEDAARKPRSANDERDWAQANVEFEDLPSPQSYTEALSIATKIHGQSYRPNPEIMDDIEAMADRMAGLHLSRSGMIDKHGPIAGVGAALTDRLRGAYLHNFTTLYGDMTPEENLRVTQRAIGRIADLIKSNAQARLQRAQQNGTPDLEAAQQDMAMAIELTSQAANPRVQSWFLGTAYRAADQLTMLAPSDTLQANEAEILFGILDHPFKQAQAAGWPDAASGDGPMARRFDGLLKRNLGADTLLPSVVGRGRGLQLKKTLSLAFRGTLVEERLGMLNIPMELAETMDPSGMLVHTHPRLVGEMASVLATHKERNFAPGETLTPQEIEERMEAQRAEDIHLPNGQTVASGGSIITDRVLKGEEVKTASERVAQLFAISAVDDLLNIGIGPLQELRLQADTSLREGADKLKDEIDATLESIGAYAMTYSDEAGDAIGKAQEFYAKAGGELGAGLSLMLGAMGGFTQKRMDEAEAEGEEDAKLAVDTRTFSHHANRWLGDIGALTQQVTDGDRIRMGLTKEVSDRIFNPNGNSFRVARIALADEVAAITVERFAPLGFSPSTIREFFKQIRSEEFGRRLDSSILRGITEEEFQTFAQRVRLNRKEAGFSLNPIVIADGMIDTIAMGVAFMGRDLRATTQMLMEEPDDLAVLIGTGAGGGYIGNQLLRGLKTQTIGRIALMQTMQRASIVLRRALNNSPDVVDQLRTITTRMQRGKKTGPAQREAAIEAATDALDWASDARKFMLEITPEMKNQRLSNWYDGMQKDASRKTAAIVRHLDPREIGNVLDELQIDGITRNWIQDGGVFSTLRQKASLALGYSAGNKKVPFVSGVGRNLFEAIQDNPEISLADLPISPEAITPRNIRFLDAMFPGKREKLARAMHQQQAMQWMQRYQADTIGRRTLGAENRALLEEWTVYGRTAEANRLRRIAGMKAVAEGTADQGRLVMLQELRAASLTRVSMFRGLRQELLDSGTPMDKTRLRGRPVFDEYTPEQMISFLGTQMDHNGIYQRLRRTFESSDSFWERIGDMGRRFDGEGGDAAADSMKRQIIAEFFEQPGLADDIRIDLLEGHISPSRLRRNIRERKDIGRAFLKDQLDELAETLDNGADRAFFNELLEEYDNELAKLGAGETSELLEGHFTTRKNLASEWKEIRRLATLETANRFRVVGGISGAAEWGLLADISRRIGDGRLRTAQADVRAYGLQQRLLAGGYLKKIGNMQRMLSRLTPEERKLFNAVAMIARDEGITGPLNKLRKRKAFKEYFDEIAPETDDVAVQHLWDTTENFRKNFLRDLKDVGLIDAKQFDKLIGPYAPRLFSSTMMPKLYGTGGVDLNLRPSPIRGASLGELSAQRHLTKVKAQVYPKGGRPITQKFDNVHDAETWIENNYGIRGGREALEEGIGETGNTTAGSKFAILRPLGKDAQLLGADLIGPGDGMFIQMRNLIEDMTQIRYFNAFDRKGIAFTEAEFIQHLIETPKDGNRFVRLADNARFGSLRNKFVHRSIVRQMENFTEIKGTMNAISDAVEAEVMLMTGNVNSLIDSAPGIITSLNAYQKAGITYNFIARNPATQIGNLLSDSLFFTRLAAGPEINFTVRGWRLGVEAFGVIRDIRSGKRALDAMPADIRRAVELGVIDESIFEVTGLQSSRKVLDIEAMYGTKKTPAEVFLAPLRDKNLQKAMAREEVVDRALKQGNLSPQMEVRLLRERFALQQQTQGQMGIMAKGMARAGNVLDAFVGKYKGRTADIEGFSATFYGDLGNTNRLRAYLWMVREKGMTPEAASSRVNRYMQTYSQIGTTALGRQVQKFGKSTLGSPIVSFPFELGRITLNAVRHNPAGMAAVMATGLSRNMMAMAASGLDPYEAVDFLVDRPGGFLNFQGDQFIGLPNHQAMVWSNPATSVFPQILNNYGVINGLAGAWDDAGDDTPLATLMRMGTSLTSNFAFTNPLLNVTLSQISKRDGLTGDVQRDGMRLLGDNVQRFISPMIHPYTPIFGTFSEKLQRTRDAFPHAYSGREHALFNKMFELGGFKVRGDVAAFLNALPPSLGEPAKDIALRGTKAVAWMSLWSDIPDERVFGKEQGLTMEDYFAQVVSSSSYLDPQNGHDMAGANEQSMTDLRRALRMLDSEDATERARGEKLSTKAQEDMIRLRTTRQQANGIPVGRKGTEREVRNIVARMQKLGEGYDEALESFSVLRRAGIVTKMLGTRGVPEEMQVSLLQQYLLTRSGGLRGPAGAEELEQTMNLLAVTLVKRPDLNDTSRERIEAMLRITQVWQIKAEVRERIENVKEEKYQRALQVMKLGRK
jgi:hypothetical protein